MQTVFLFINIIACIVFVVTSGWWFLTVFVWVFDHWIADQRERKLKEALLGKKVYPVFKRSIIPTITGSWLLAVWMTSGA